MILKKFNGPKSLDVIRAQCASQDLILEAKRYEDDGSDYVTVYSPKAPDARVLFSTVTGYFFGVTDRSLEFSSDDQLDGVSWFDALLDFFLEPLLDEKIKELGLDIPLDVGAFRDLVNAVAGVESPADNAAPLNLGELAFEAATPTGVHAVPYDGYTTKLHKGIS
jgi:hypothetical protein